VSPKSREFSCLADFTIAQPMIIAMYYNVLSRLITCGALPGCHQTAASSAAWLTGSLHSSL
jgi:hypothetical protein